MMAVLALGRVRIRRGDPGADAALDEALALADPTCTLQRLGPVRAARAEAAWMAGDPERPSRRRASDPGARLPAAAPLALGRAVLLALAPRRPRPRPPGEAAGAVPPPVEGDWRRTAAAWARLGCPYEAARRSPRATRRRRCAPRSPRSAGSGAQPLVEPTRAAAAGVGPARGAARPTSRPARATPPGSRARGRGARAVARRAAQRQIAERLTSRPRPSTTTSRRCSASSAWAPATRRARAVQRGLAAEDGELRPPK